MTALDVCRAIVLMRNVTPLGKFSLREIALFMDRDEADVNRALFEARSQLYVIGQLCKPPAPRPAYTRYDVTYKGVRALMEPAA